MAYSHDTVAHNWAHQTGKKCRGFNMFYEGETIYSYGSHFPIARFFTAPNGERVVLFNEDSYSVSTSKHQTIVRRALGWERDDILGVPFLRDHVGMILVNGWIERLDEDIETSAGKWKRARVYKDSHARRMAQSVQTINRIIDLWQLDVPYRTMPDDINAWVDEALKRHAEEAAAKDRADREAIKRWLNGEDIHPPHTRIPYVRVKSRRCGPEVNEHGDFVGMTTQVETSWGVKVPLADAMKLHRMAGLVRIVGKTWRPSKRHQIGGWPVDHIAADGTLKAGCHVIPFKVQQEAARLAGLDATTFHINQANQMEAA
jgi:hypothetical protein